jgi:hypothetical protein
MSVRLTAGPHEHVDVGVRTDLAHPNCRSRAPGPVVLIC